MFDKKQVSQNIKKLERVKTWQLVVLLVFAVFITASLLRLNNIGMVERRAAVLSADREGDNEVTKRRLYDLQRYVTSHMNANMDKGVYLEASYGRDTQAAYTRAAESNSNGNIYKKAQEVCAPQFISYSVAYLSCVTAELGKYPAADSLAKSVVLPRADSYRHVFVSPLWSPDFAGWAVIICIVILTMILVRLTTVSILKIILHYRYKSF